MSNSFLNPDEITRSALMILHQKLNFVGNINRQYDASFAKEGAKIGSTLRIRMPNEYTVSSGATFVGQDTNEVSQTLTVSTQRHVGMPFSDADLTLKIDDFAKRYVDPAVSVLAARMEADALTMHKDIYQVIDNIGSSLSMRQVADANAKLTNALCPPDGRWVALVQPQDNADLVNANKGLFQAATEISDQYRKGKMGTTGGFDFYESTYIGTNASGTTSATNNWTVNSSLTVSSVTATSAIDIINNTGPQGTWAVGDVFTITGITRCHPETKDDTGEAMQFVVSTAVSATSATSITFTPPIFLSGGRQNVVNTTFSTKAIVKVGATSATYKPSLFFHPDAFTFATADMPLPKGTDMASRQNKDGLAIRLIRDYDSTNDRRITRLDVIYGFKTIRPQLATRILNR